MDERIMVGDAIYADIEENAYLKQIYGDLLYNYGLHTLPLAHPKPPRPVDVRAALRFSDLLSKSTHGERAGQHQLWAQELASLLHALYPKDHLVSTTLGAVLTSTGNTLGLAHIDSDYEETSVCGRIFEAYRRQLLTIPAQPDQQFYADQKVAYDHFDDPFFSYSAPTSMGKSYIMRMFIKAQVMAGTGYHFALLVPTKALISEVRAAIIGDLKDLLAQKDYRVVSSAGDIALEQDHHFILVLTPERLLYLLGRFPELPIHYLFVDEAHQLSEKNDRSPFYYAVVDRLHRRRNPPHIIFASPGIPNPQVYLRLLGEEVPPSAALATEYAPVSQFKFLLDMESQSVAVYNSHTQTLKALGRLSGRPHTLADVIRAFAQGADRPLRTLVYVSSKANAVEDARRFADHLPEQEDVELLALARDVRQQIHKEFYLAALLTKGVAYHIGHLPAGIRAGIETLFKAGKITTLFCTSTLMEGVNLPADQLFITSDKAGKGTLNDVAFRNLTGRVGRIQYGLCGNVYLVASGQKARKTFETRLETPVAEQALASAKHLPQKYKKHIVTTLLSGSAAFPVYTTARTKQPHREYLLMRKFGLLLLDDLMADRNTQVVRDFKGVLKPGDAETIRVRFAPHRAVLNGDINISMDQTLRLREALAADPDFSYPQPNAEKHFDYYEVMAFLTRLGDVFMWRQYESDGLGRLGKETGEYSMLSWYAVLLIQWMEGHGLAAILGKAIKYYEKHPGQYWKNSYTPECYEGSVEQKNGVINNTLEAIDRILLFRLSNYFLRFSEEYQAIHGEAALDQNNWYEFVDYGTMDSIIILLQRHGFTREAAAYIRDHQSSCIAIQPDGKVKLARAIWQCGNGVVLEELPDILFNRPELLAGVGDVR